MRTIDLRSEEPSDTFPFLCRIDILHDIFIRWHWKYNNSNIHWSTQGYRKGWVHNKWNYIKSEMFLSCCLLTHMLNILYVQEVVRGDPSPGVWMFLLGQTVLKVWLLSPDLLRSGALALPKQSSHLHLVRQGWGGDITGRKWTKWACCGWVVNNDPSHDCNTANTGPDWGQCQLTKSSQTPIVFYFLVNNKPVC